MAQQQFTIWSCSNVFGDSPWFHIVTLAKIRFVSEFCHTEYQLMTLTVGVVASVNLIIGADTVETEQHWATIRLRIDTVIANILVVHLISVLFSFK